MDKVGGDIVLLHGCPQSCVPNSVEGLLEVYEDVVEVCWCWRYFSQRMCRLKICSEACLFFTSDLLFKATNLVILGFVLFGFISVLFVVVSLYRYFISSKMTFLSSYPLAKDIASTLGYLNYVCT